MNTETTGPKFRENATTAVTRDAKGITIHIRGVDAPIVLRFDQLSEAVKTEAMGYGMEVRLTRAAALERDTKSGKSATPQDKHAAILKLAEHYASGTEAWAMSGGGGLSDETRVLIEALCTAFGLATDVAEEQVRALSGAERAQLRVDGEIKPHIDAIYARRASAQGSETAKSLIERLRNAQAKTPVA
jgi:hypothetical protein